MDYSCYRASDFSNNDFNIVQYGFRECMPGFCVYYDSCPSYLFHYIYSGEGTFCIKSSSGQVRKYNLSANRAFIVYPGQEVWYSSDRDNPFSYRWVEFYGNKALDFLLSAHLTVDSPVIATAPPYECGSVLKAIIDGGVISPMRLTGLFWIMADSLAKDTSRASDNLSVLFNNALRYIHDNVRNRTSVEDVAAAINVSRGYLSKIFSNFIEQTPKQYITAYHIDEAKSLLSGTNLTVSEVGENVGYENVSDFTRNFKKLTGQTPSEFRREHLH